MVDTARVKDHRPLRFNASGDVLADADRIAASERAGKLRLSGNWTAGQSFGHLAMWIDYAYDGYPPGFGPPLIVRFVIKTFMKKRFIHGPMKTGVRIPGVKGGTLAIEPIPLETGLDHLRRAWARLDAAPPGTPNILLGPLTHDEWKKLHLRHAELHMGFLHP